MKKQKLFIFMSFCIVPIGGMEMHMAGLSKYLEKNGWKVFIFTPEPSELKTAIPSLQKYLKAGGNVPFVVTPPYKTPAVLQEIGMNLMVKKLTDYCGNLSKYDEIVIESCESIRSFWAELLAEKIGARHIFMATEENPRLGACCYEDNLDFYYFKFKRNELVGFPQNVRKLFNGYKDVNDLIDENAPLYLAETEPIQDVPDFPINNIQKLDWNICHFGRTMKPFVPHVIAGVGEFARRHPDKKINFIFIGQIIPERETLIRQTFEGLDNVMITPLGDMVPIPRSLFSKIDVVCAMAGCATYSSFEGVPVIVGNAVNPDKTNGVLGVDTKDTVYDTGDKISYAEALENVLVKKLYDGKNFDLPDVKPSEDQYADLWKVLDNVAPEKVYFTQKLKQERPTNQMAIFPFGSISAGAKIILFGATDIAKDYRKQVGSQGNIKGEFGNGYVKYITRPLKYYCDIVATVDEHPEEFDDAVLSPERLQQRDYDAIVMTTYPQNAQSAYAKIQEIVPDMLNRVVYNPQFVTK